MKKIALFLILLAAGSSITAGAQSQSQSQSQPQSRSWSSRILQQMHDAGWEVGLKAGVNIGGSSPLPLPREIRSIESFNPTLARLMDRTEESVRAMDWSQGFGADTAVEDVRRLRPYLDRLREPGDHTGVDYQIYTGKGRTVHLHSSNDYISREPEGDVIQRLTYDVTERVRLERALKRLSLEDALTGLYNRARFNEAVAWLQQQPPRRLGVAVFDLNGLKAWNDRYGHSAGDDFIRRAASAIAAAFPGRAHRVGGDEFLVLDCNLGEDAFQGAVDRALEAMAAQGVSAAAGVSWHDGERCDVRAQMDEADRRMYEAKARHYDRQKE